MIRREIGRGPQYLRRGFDAKMTEIDVLNGREPVGVPEERLRDGLEFVRETLGLKWLQKRKAHPLRRLWNELDAFSTVELYWLGASLQRCMQSAPAWLPHHVSRIKGDDKGSRVGSVFEILALASLMNDDGRLIAAPEATPYYDAEYCRDGHTSRLSLKSFGALQVQTDFQRRAERLFELAQRQSASMALGWCGCIFLARTFPKDSDWDDLESALSTLILPRQSQVRSIGLWDCLSMPAPPGLAANPPSYQFLVASPVHHGENGTYLGRIGRELAKFDAANFDDPTIQKIVLIRLAEKAPLAACLAAANQYLQEQARSLDAILLYQCAMASDPSLETSGIQHTAVAATRTPLRTPLDFQFAVGKVSNSPPADELRMGDRHISLSDYHWAQRGNLFKASVQQADGSITGTMRTLSPGVVEHAVMTVPGGENVILSPKHAQRFDFRLFS